MNLSPDEKNPWNIVQAILQLMMGRSNAVGVVTLRANQTTTVVTKATDPAAVNVSAGAQVLLSPRTANAAAALATTFVSSIGQGTFTLTHSSNAQTDKTFGFAALGG